MREIRTLICWATLNNTVDLLNISYHAVYGFPEQSQVFGLQKGVMDLNDKGIVVVTDFKDQASVVVAELVGVYRWLIKGMESVAISKLEQFASRAAGMSEQATEMADGYQAAADRTSAVLQKVMDQNAAQVEKSAELTRMMKELEAAQESVAAIQKSVEERLSGMNQEYRRLVKVDEDVRSHKQTMDIMGAVFGFLGSAVSVAGAAMGAGSTVGTGTSGSDMQGQQDYAEAESDKKDLERQFEDKEQEISDLEKKVQDLIAEKDAAEETEKERLEKEISAARKKISAARKEKENLEIKKKAAADKLEKLGGMLGAQGTQMQQAAAAGADADAARADQMNAIYTEIMNLEKQKTEQVGLLAKYAKQMEATVIDQHSTEAAIQSLILAVSCLKKSVVALKDIALFWSSLERSCRALAGNTLKDDIKALQSADKADRIEAYQSPEIMYPIASYMAKWVAILSISRDYLAAAEKTRSHLNDTVGNSDSVTMSREDHWELASRLAGEVGDSLTRQIAGK
ncbi:MAG: hypothetical protein K1W26_06790 [Acetatifactor sp.]